MIDKEYISSVLGISNNKLEEMIKEKLNQYKNLIDEETAILLILKDKGLSIEDIYNTKVKNIYPGMKINQIKLKINRILIKKDNMIILEAGDKTGMIKLIIKDKNWKLKENILKEGKNIILKNGIVLNDYYLAIFVNNINYISQTNEEIEINNSYISYRYIKLLKEDENNYIVLTDNFYTLYLTKNIQIDNNKTYTIKFYNKKPIEVIELKTY